MKSSILLNTAKRPEFLDRCLTAFYNQFCMDFEVIIADDGSDQETLKIVSRHQQTAPFPITHIWHPPEGHRRAEILNKGIAASMTPYIIFTDCDSLAPSWFVERHLKKRRPNRLLIGGRIKLDKKQTDDLWMAAIRSGEFESLASKATLRKLRLRHWKNIWQILTGKKRRPHNYGLNMSIYKTDLERINGYDNLYRGWGNADGDLRERLKMVGIWPLSASREVYVFHQWHPTIKRGTHNRKYSKRPNIPACAENGLAEAWHTYQSVDRQAYESFKKQSLSSNRE